MLKDSGPDLLRLCAKLFLLPSLSCTIVISVVAVIICFHVLIIVSVVLVTLMQSYIAYCQSV